MRFLLLLVMVSVLVFCGCPQERDTSGSPKQYDDTEALKGGS